jgi:hypothetical protein
MDSQGNEEIIHESIFPENPSRGEFLRNYVIPVELHPEACFNQSFEDDEERSGYFDNVQF